MTAGRHDDNAHEQWDELAVGYALSALEPDEAERFVNHLIGRCRECNRVVADTNTVGAGLAAAFPVPEPRAGLRTDVLGAALAARPAVPQTSADLAGMSAVPLPSRTDLDRRPADLRPAPSNLSAHAGSVDDHRDGGDELSQVRQRRQRRSVAGRTSWMVAAAAAVVAVVMSAVTALALHSRSDERSVADARQQVISAFTAGGSARVVSLRRDGGNPVATVLAHKDSVTVVPNDMTPNSKTTSYVLWGIASSTSAPVALGVFDVAGSGSTATQVATDSRGYAGFDSFAISHEPGHTPPATPSQIIATGQV